MAEHVVVIGAGVYGAAVAASLVRRGAKVTVVEAGAPAGGTSGATFSWLNSCGKQPRTYHDLNVAGMAAHRKLAAELPPGDWYHDGGNLEWAADEPGRAELRRKVAGVLDYGYPAQWLTRTQALRLEPDLNPAQLPPDEIAYFPDEAWIEPTRMIAHLLAAAVTNGAELIHHDPVTALEINHDTTPALKVSGGTTHDNTITAVAHHDATAHPEIDTGAIHDNTTTVPKSASVLRHDAAPHPKVDTGPTHDDTTTLPKSAGVIRHDATAHPKDDAGATHDDTIAVPEITGVAPHDDARPEVDTGAITVPKNGGVIRHGAAHPEVGSGAIHGDAVAGPASGGGVVRDAAIDGPAGGRVVRVRLASGRWLAVDAVVNCAGPQAARIAELAGLVLPMRNKRGVLVYTSPVAVAVSRVVHAPRVNLRPDGGGRLLLHTGSTDDAAHVSETGETSVDQSAVNTVLAAAQALYPGIRAATVESVRVGERPIPADGLPVLGRAAAVPNFHFAVSHSGATLCLHAGDVVAAEALGENQDDALSPFRFERLQPHRA